MEKEKLLCNYLNKIHPSLSKVMQAIKKKAQEDSIPIISDEIGRLLCFLVSLKKPKRILELGTGISYSTHWLLLGNKETGLVSVDQNNDRILLAETFLKGSNFLTRVNLHSGWIEDFFISNREVFDMVFLDSQKSTYAIFLENINKILKSGGLLIVDNALFKNQVFLPTELIAKKQQNAVEGIRKFNELIFNHPQFENFLFALGDGVLISTKK